LSNKVGVDEVVVTDTGCALAWTMQAFEFRGQRFIHALNNTPMGYGLPAAIGAASTGKRVTLITGDGSIMMSIGELATIAKHKLPIRIYLLNNGGHAMCRQTENQWLGGVHHGTDLSDLAFPDFRRVFDAFGVNGVVVDIPEGAKVSPQARYGKPNEDQDPPLPRDELQHEMLIPLVA
jgi:acetolactate synthase-1/2/3 large subunit